MSSITLPKLIRKRATGFGLPIHPNISTLPAVPVKSRFR
jgi:hypothetical protein